MHLRERADKIWSTAQLLNGCINQHEYGKIILPFTVLRRLDELLDPTREKVLAMYEKRKKLDPEALENLLNQIAGYRFHNCSNFNLKSLVNDTHNLRANLTEYIRGFSRHPKDIFNCFNFEALLAKLEEKQLLFPIVKEFSTQSYNDLTPMQMGSVFEYLICKLAETNNETEGEHFTPWDVSHLMVNILFEGGIDSLFQKNIQYSLYDPACGNSGLLSVSNEFVKNFYPDTSLLLFGQDLNPENYAISKSIVLIKGQNPAQIKLGNSFTSDKLNMQRFHYMLCHPPFHVEWIEEKKFIEDEHTKKGFGGRFGAGLPRLNDGSMLFLQHLISKMREEKQGSRIGILLDESLLSYGEVDSGENKFRQWLIEKDYLESIIALPNQLFFHTDSSIYFWIINNRKSKERRSKVQLMNAAELYKEMIPFQNYKRKFITPELIQKITREYAQFKDSKICRIFDSNEFGYHRIILERPRRDFIGNSMQKSGKLIPDIELRRFKNIPLKENVQIYFEKKILPYLKDAWIDHGKTQIGYKIHFDRYFYDYASL